ncbi:glucose dehydrogenase [FAD, quinone]-like [Belonocnema kinseyi]|uniref:glucose dehydrogenase [FAD, quinone]-like n=1 Tax=Belonocnema kinseyi TaxID=2817044 RepID=UPI00143D2947|nr:glucose dehydrogenase [FAD, quinone]-like [Belonocnema kinseyi]
MSWIPENLPAICATEPNGSSCSSSQILFLAFVANLFSDSRDKSHKQNAEPKEYDFIVVGGGTAGCVVTNRLSKIKSWKVLLLEQGIEEPQVVEVPAFIGLLPGSNIMHKYDIQPDTIACKMQPCSVSRGKVLGGSSSVGDMLYARGNRVDFDDWEKMGCTGWSYEEVLPYFKYSEDNLDKDIIEENPEYHATGGYQSVQKFPYTDVNTKIAIEAFQELGYKLTDPNGETQLGVSNAQWTIKNGVRVSTNAGFIRPIRNKRSNLFIKTGAHVTRVIIDPETKQALGVEYKYDGKSEIAYAKKEVIISAGTIESPKLLMLSGIGPKEILEKHNIDLIQDLPVGRNMHTHIEIGKLDFSFRNKNYSTLTTLEEMKQDVLRYLKTHAGPDSTRGLSAAMAFVKTKFEKNENAPDIKIEFHPDELPYQPSVYYDSFSVTVILLTPKIRGYVTLNDTYPISGNPAIFTGNLAAESDIDALIEGIHEVLKLADTKIFNDSGYEINKVPIQACQEFEFGNDDYFKCMIPQYAAFTSDYVGTCKMGTRDSGAVVDPRLKVYGVNGMRVIDASNMPAVVRGNPIVATIMIAEKGGEMIKEDWKINNCRR